MKAEDFIVKKRPRLASITKHQKVELADYERRLALMQSTLQAIQQAYLGTRERAVVVLEGWDTAGKGGVVRRLGWALDPRSFKVLGFKPCCRGKRPPRKWFEAKTQFAIIIRFELDLFRAFKDRGWITLKSFGPLAAPFGATKLPAYDTHLAIATWDLPENGYQVGHKLT